MKKVNIRDAFNWLDFCSFGMATIIALVIAIWALFQDISGNEKGLLFALAACFGFIYIQVFRSKYNILKKFPWKVGRFNIRVNLNNYLGVIDVKDEVEEEIVNTIVSYQNYFEEDLSKNLMNGKIVWIEFRKGPFEHPVLGKQKLMGITSYGGESIVVGYRNSKDEVFKTALKHELGHVILGRQWNDWSQKRHHDWMKRNHLL